MNVVIHSQPLQGQFSLEPIDGPLPSGLRGLQTTLPPEPSGHPTDHEPADYAQHECQHYKMPPPSRAAQTGTASPVALGNMQ